MGDFDEPGYRPAATQLNSAAGGGKSKVQTRELTNAANALVGIRADFRKADDKADDEVREAGRKLGKAGGWQTAGALGAFADRWNAQVKHLHTAMQQISDKLHETRGSYTRREEQERANSDKIRQDFG